MNPGLQQLISVALPIMVTLVATVWIAQWSQNKRFDYLSGRFNDLRSDMNRQFGDMKSEMNRRFEDVIRRLDRIEKKLDDHEERIVRVEERTSLLRR